MISPALASRAANRWDITNLELIGRSANAVYKGLRGSETVFLRLLHCEQRDELQLASGIDWARHLATQGAAVTVALESKSGFLIEEIDTVWFATCWRGISGTPLGDDLSPVQLEAWGAALGKLHLASSSYVPNLTRTPNGDFLPERFYLAQFWRNIRDTLESDAELLVVYQELTTWLAELPTEELLICHGDFRPANAIWDGEKVSVIDFDEPTVAHPEYDIARACLRDDRTPFPIGHLEVFLRGYNQILPCNLARVTNYLRVRVLLMLTWDMQDNSTQTSFLEFARGLLLEKTFYEIFNQDSSTS
jgi:Ser/Thr protein kinase RdoA (MazF antagonist)